MIRSLRYPVLALLLVCALAFGQSPSRAGYKGGYLVSGQAGASLIFHKEAEGATNTELSLNLAPRALYFLMDGLGLGLEVNSGYFADGYKETWIGVGPRIAYYLVQTDTKYPHACCLTPYFGPGWWMPYAGLSVLYLSDRYVQVGNASTYSGWRARIGAGMSPLIGERGTMPIEIGYEMQSIKYTNAGSTAQSRSKVYLEVGFGAFLFK
jgi:hypothetical protein